MPARQMVCHAAKTKAKAKQPEADPSVVQLLLFPIKGLSVPANLYTAAEVAVVLAELALVDAGFSGDWVRIGVITPDLELAARNLVWFTVFAHTITAFLAAKLAPSRGMSPVLAAVQGFATGTLTVNRLQQTPEIPESKR
eukprot:CAMPEP_0119102564 /NCGR_PEP_ID=MMETSP1180-20130426/1275_1 /TAXON_ID=3052 ORGANISM="Chlamydomonas cf sp, Strain CCMP681" /NCGR_SAMPLE_ID=MMETSP1180 /ASSEMBLY_ACC=CAM_ASM_000741 /LENGTH=139 /DNA_ID=CAMNT_0007086875 /DNA_START=127 /DNA_END=546 /DNA_ORIENTATION=-